MESQEEEVAEKECVDLTVDFSKQSLRRIERASNEHQLAETLLLDNNEIQKLDNLETYSNLKKLSIVNNQLIRMYGVSTLVHLTTLDISNNALVVIEGLKNLVELKELNLSKNRIKSIDHLKTNLKLEKLDLSGNNIMCISDVSFLEQLRVCKFLLELKLHGNRINHLTQCEKYLPQCLEVFTVNNNLIADLNEVSYLSHLTSLREFSIVNNPCLDFSEDQKFNYRPFIKNWISSLVILDNSPLDDIECLKGEWLYSQGRGRSFRPGEHAALIEYLNSVCPKEGKEDAETEDVKKLKLILSKAQLHQQQLREQLSTGKLATVEASKSSVPKKKPSLTSDRMVTSFQDSPRDYKSTPDRMTRSLDSGMLRKSSKTSRTDPTQTPLQTSTTFIPIPDTLISPDVGQTMVVSCSGAPSLSSRTSRSSSRNSPRSTPESKRKSSISVFQRRRESSPLGLKKAGKLINSRSSTPLDVGSSPGRSTSSRSVTSPAKKGSGSRDSDRHFRETSEEEDSEILAMRIRAVQMRTNQRKQYKVQQTEKTKGSAEENKNFKESKATPLPKDLTDTKAWKAAVTIQRWWRGYRARNLNGEVLTGCKNIQMSRMQDYITKVVNDMEATRVALEGNRKLVVLQMQAINSLWKKITALQPSVGPSPGENQLCLQNLVETCATLNKQVEGLQAMMKSMQVSSASTCVKPIATQTEIVAVHTPQGDAKEFPYNPNLKAAEDSSSVLITESDDKYFGESLNESDNGSTTCTVKTVTEIYNNSMAEDASAEDVFSSPKDDNCSSVLGEKLTKPTIKLNETNSEVPVSSELENPRKEEESEDGCNS